MTEFHAHATRTARARVAHSVVLRCVDNNSRVHDLAAQLSYDANDPFAVALSFPGHPTVRPWIFGRDLLIDGLNEPAGDGDVHVWPSIDPNGRAVIVIELSSPHGELISQVGAKSLRDFVEEILTVVPAGTEADHLDIDALLADLFV